jgi:aminopeptidase N
MAGAGAHGYNPPMRPLPPLLALALAACHTEAPKLRKLPTAPPDVHSAARPNEVRSTHLDLRLQLDFDGQFVTGTATHHIERLADDAPFVVDTQGLDIRAVHDEAGNWLPHWFGAKDQHLGTPLVIGLRGGTTKVAIDYRSAPDAEAMQWLAPEQTNGGKAPFLFTQGQAILTRTWIPLQDTPAVRITWTAEVAAPRGLVPVMSATERTVDGAVVRFAMDKPVPSYLIALACGDLVRRELGPRCAVWAEPGVIDLAASELGDTEAMIAACEREFGPYRWGRYDVLVLPPSFPFGGMENPCLTFATPTILAGDRSLVSLIAHELAHSWSGNLVTNATWRDFWLNEGFTVYLENRIMAAVFGRDRAAMEEVLGMQELGAELKTLPAADQVLHIDLGGRNPDDGMTGVPYQKGAAFLRRIEQVVGRPALDAFLKAWFDQHAFQSVTTDTFLSFLDRELLSRHPAAKQAIDVEHWVRGSGLPADAEVPQSTLFAAVDAALERWRGGAAPGELSTKGWVTQQWLRFLAGLEAPSPQQLAALDQAFAFTRSGNSEILCSWLVLAIRADYRAVDRRLELFLMTVGRRKFLKPIYEALLAAPDGLARAQAIYRKARPRYHAVSQRTLDAMVGTPKPATGG